MFAVGSLVGTAGWTTCWSTACCAIARNEIDSAPALLEGPLTKGREDAAAVAAVTAAELLDGGGSGDGAVLIDEATVPVDSTETDELNLDGTTTGTAVGCCCCCCCCCCCWGIRGGAGTCAVVVTAGDCCCEMGDDSAWPELLLELPSDSDWTPSSLVTAL